MDKIKELRMTLIIVLMGVFFMSGCFFNDKHTVTFKTNGGSEVKNISVKSGSKLETIETPVKDGYIFDGWYLDGEEFNFDTKVSEDITLVAKWIKESFDENNTGESSDTEPTTTTTSTTTKKVQTTKASNTDSTNTKTTKKTTKKTTTKKTTTTTTTTTTQKIVVTTTQKVEETSPITPGIDVPVIDPTETVPTTKTIDIKIELIKETEKVEDTEKLEENTEAKDDLELEKEGIEYLKLTRTLEDVNVISNISDIDLTSLLKSDMNSWQIISNHAYMYEYTVENGVVLLKGDKDVTSFTVVYDGSSYIFDYDSELENWIIKYPTVSVGIGLDQVYYNNIETAIGVAKAGNTIKLLADQEVSVSLKLDKAVTIDGSNYKITNKEGYLFNIEDILYDEKSELIIMDLVLDVDSFIYIGKSKFESIVLNNVTGNIKNHKMDKEPIGLFENTSLLQQLQ